MTALRRVPGGPVRFLASVGSLNEALIAHAGGADLIDAKDAGHSAFGQVRLDEILAIRARLPQAILSATTGEPATDAGLAVAACVAVAATGVDFVKVAIEPGREGMALIAALGNGPIESARLVAVLPPEAAGDDAVMTAMARAGFAGVMLDTFDKRAGALPDRLAPDAIAAFIALARGRGLFAGLAGALRLPHIPALLALGPDILGFRGALCRDNDRAAPIDGGALAAVRATIPGRQTAIAAVRRRAVLVGEGV